MSQHRRGDHTRLDEDDVRVRPRRGKSRPRSKDRPSHEVGTVGRVVAVDRGRFTCVLETAETASDPPARPVTVFAVKARELGRKGVVVGDEVWLTGDVSGRPDALARIVRVHQRSTTLRRSADDIDPVERVIVANADQLAVVAALRDPEPSPGLIDRALVAAFDAGLDPLIILTKSDLADPQDLVELYATLEVAVIAVGLSGTGHSGTGHSGTGGIGPGGGADEGTGEGSHDEGSDDEGSGLDRAAVQEIRRALAGRTTVLLGHSGVGKSTLVNALVPGADRSTGIVNAVTGRGRHTSSQAVAMALPEGGWIIDTPGVRSLGLAHVDPDRVLKAFADFAEAAEDACPRGCLHGADAPECALDAFVESGAAGPAGPARLASLRRLLASMAAAPRPGEATRPASG